MAKKLTLICLFLFCIAGVKAQTYCYHAYRYYDFQNIPHNLPNGSYRYYTFQDNLMYQSEKDGSIYVDKTWGLNITSTIWKLFEVKDDVLKYVEIDKNGKWQFDKRFWLVSRDSEYMNLVYPYEQPQPDYIKIIESANLYYEKVTCFKKHSSVDNRAYEVPAMKF